MKKLLKTLLIIFLVLIFILAGIVVFLKYSDLNKYKPQIESMAKKYANIDIKINGDLDLGVSLKPSLQLKDVVIYKPESEDVLLQAERALAQISLIPLLKKQIVVDVVEFDNTDIFTDEKTSIKINNLDLKAADFASPITFSFDTDISGLNIAGKGETSSLQKIQENDYNNIDLKTTVSAMGYNLDFDGSFSGLKDKITAAGDYIVSFKNNKINGNVSVDLSNETPYIKLAAESQKINVADFMNSKQAAKGGLIKSANAEEYIPQTTIPYSYLQMVDADIDFKMGEIAVNPDIKVSEVVGIVNLKNGVFKADLNKMMFENNLISGHVEITSPKNLPYVKLNIKGGGFDLVKLQKTGTKKADNTGWLIGKAYASELLPNIVIPYQYLQMANADFSAKLNTLKINPDIAVSNVSLNGSLKNGVLNTNVDNITAGDGTVKGNIVLNAKNKALSVNLSGKNVILQNLYKPFASSNSEVFIKKGGKSNFEIKINTSGDNTNQYLSNMNGQIIALTDDSVLKVKSLEKLQGNIFAQILSVLKLNISDKDLNLSCAVVRGDINKGLVNFPKGIVFNASDFYLVSNGTLNLKNDKLDMELQPFSGKITDVNISSILGNLVKITGTVSNPKIGINQTETAKNIVGIIASGGVYNVGDLMLSADGAPCHTALKSTSYADYFKADNSVKGTVSKGYTSTQDTIKNVGKDIKKQTKDLKKQIKGLFK